MSCDAHEFMHRGMESTCKVCGHTCEHGMWSSLTLKCSRCGLDLNASGYLAARFEREQKAREARCKARLVGGGEEEYHRSWHADGKCGDCGKNLIESGYLKRREEKLAKAKAGAEAKQMAELKHKKMLAAEHDEIGIDKFPAYKKPEPDNSKWVADEDLLCGDE